MLRLEHDLTPSVTVRNQTRYNTTTREAVITSIPNAAAYNPATNLVTLSRQANERHNDIFSNQTNLSARVSTGRLRHELSAGMEISSESQFAPTLVGCRHARARRSQPSRRLQPGRRHGHRPDRRDLRGRDRHRRGLSLRRVRPRPARPCQRRDPRGELQHEIALGDGRGRPHRHRRRRHARQRQGRTHLPV